MEATKIASKNGIKEATIGFQNIITLLVVLSNRTKKLTKLSQNSLQNFETINESIFHLNEK